MVSIVKSNRDGFVSYDVYLNDDLLGRFDSYYRAVALVVLLGE
jgi:hypothetical protein